MTHVNYDVILISREELVWFDENHYYLKREDLQSLHEEGWVRDSVSAFPLMPLLSSIIMRDLKHSLNDT